MIRSEVGCIVFTVGCPKGYELQETPSADETGPEAPVPADPSWTPLEGWVWQKLHAGGIANIDEYQVKGVPFPPANPRKPEDWQDGHRRLSTRFLEALLLCEPYRSNVHHKGVRIEGAWFDDEIDLEAAEVMRDIRLNRCRFKQPVRLIGLRTPRSVSFDASAFAADLYLQRARIGDQLTAIGASLRNLVLNGVKVDQIILVGAKVVGELALESADIGGSLHMHSDPRISGHRTNFNKVVLSGAKVGGQVSLAGAKVAGPLNMDSADIGVSLQMNSDSNLSGHRAEFEEVVLSGAKVGGQVSLTGAKVAGPLKMDSADIGRSLLMASVSEHRAEFKEVVLRGAKVGGQIALIGTKVF